MPRDRRDYAAMTTPVTSAQAEAPYGIAFICLAFGLYSASFLDLIDGWIRSIAGSKGASDREKNE